MWLKFGAAIVVAAVVVVVIVDALSFIMNMTEWKKKSDEKYCTTKIKLNKINAQVIYRIYTHVLSIHRSTKFSVSNELVLLARSLSHSAFVFALSFSLLLALSRSSSLWIAFRS